MAEIKQLTSPPYGIVVQAEPEQPWFPRTYSECAQRLSHS